MYDQMTLYARTSFEFLDDSLNDTRDMKEFYDVLASVYGIARRYADIDDEPKHPHQKRNLPSSHEEKTQKNYNKLQKETSVVFLNPFITVKQVIDLVSQYHPDAIIYDSWPSIRHGAIFVRGAISSLCLGALQTKLMDCPYI